MSGQSQAEVITFLSDGTNLPDRAPVTVVQTHGALVFLCGADAYKIKRDVRYDYLDFSTLQKRHDMLVRELELNAPMAPSIYRDVIAVTRDADGCLQLDGKGAAVEWVLRMHRFDTVDELDKVAGRGALDDRMAEDLGAVIARYHATTPDRREIAGSDLIDAILDELNTAFAAMTGQLEADQVGQFRLAGDRAFGRAKATLDVRGIAGHVRRCHGDLHMRNIVLIDGAPTLFDALEFDETLGTCDVLYDLAFLLMDLCHKGLPRPANIVLNSYLFHAANPDHLAGLSLLPLFQSIRAAIRAMVAVQTARFNPDDAALLPEARRYLSGALAVLDPAPARLIAIGGLSGSGKTVLAAAIAHLIGAAPGAVHLRSDLERKALFGVTPQTRLPGAAYGAAANARVHAVLRDKAQAILSAGHSAILDATWLDAQERAHLPDLARQSGARFSGLWLTAELAVLERRVGARQGDASDADAAVVRQQAEGMKSPQSWAQIDASGSVDETCRLVLRHLSGPQAATRLTKGDHNA